MKYKINGEKIRKKRMDPETAIKNGQEKRLNQTELIELMKENGAPIGRNSLSALENGELPKEVTLKQIVTLCEILDCDLNYILDISDYSTKKIEVICEYTRLSEKTVRLLHKSPKEPYLKENLSAWLSDLLDNYPEFRKLLDNLRDMLLHTLVNRTLHNMEKYDRRKDMVVFLKNRSDSNSKVALLECQTNITRIEDGVNDDKYLYDVMTWSNPYINGLLSKKEQ